MELMRMDYVPKLSLEYVSYTGVVCKGAEFVSNKQTNIQTYTDRHSSLYISTDCLRMMQLW